MKQPAQIVIPQKSYDDYIKLVCGSCKTIHAIVLRENDKNDSVICSVCQKIIPLLSFKDRSIRRQDMYKEGILYDFFARKEYSIYIIDISPKGAKIQSPIQIKPHQVVQIKTKELTATGEPRWVRRLKKTGIYEVGIQFIEFEVLDKSAITQTKA